MLLAAPRTADTPLLARAHRRARAETARAGRERGRSSRLLHARWCPNIGASRRDRSPRAAPPRRACDRRSRLTACRRPMTDADPPRADLRFRQDRAGRARPLPARRAASRSCPPAARRRRCARPASPVNEVADHTGFPEIMDGRVKTLHPKIHGGLLGRRDAAGARGGDGASTASRRSTSWWSTSIPSRRRWRRAPASTTASRTSTSAARR